MELVEEDVKPNKCVRPGSDNKAADLNKFLVAGYTDRRNPTSQRFSRFLKGDASSRTKFNAAVATSENKHLANQYFRRKWVVTEFDNCMTVVKQSKLEEWMRVDGKKGAYGPLEVIASRKGGGRTTPTSLVAAVRYATKCRVLSGQ